MILVTGAAGKTGQAVIRALVARGERVRAFVYRPDQVNLMRALGAQEVVTGDMRTQGDMMKAFAGIQAVYHIAPNMTPYEIQMGELAITSAQRAKVAHFVYHSVLHPQTEAMPHHWHKLRVEEHLFQSRLAYTILQPAAYMQNILAYWGQIVTEGVYRVPYAAETRLGMVDLPDVAEAAAIVLTEAGHTGAIYELAGPEPLTQTEVAATLSRQLGRSIRVEVLSHPVWTQQARKAGLSDYAIQTLLKMFRYYENYNFWSNPNVLCWLIGRSPATFEAFLMRQREIGNW